MSNYQQKSLPNYQPSGQPNNQQPNQQKKPLNFQPQNQQPQQQKQILSQPSSTQQLQSNQSQKPPSYFPQKVPAPEYQNNPLLEQFSQADTGFGFSNFRIESTLPETINRTSSDFQLEDVQQYTNPISEYEYARHANFLFREHYGDYNMIDEQKVPDDYIYLDIIKTFQERNPLLDFFFCKKNLDHIQRLIIKMIEHQSGGSYKISRQCDSELLTIMRSIYIQTPTNPYTWGNDFKGEICKLNKNVLDWAVPHLIVNIQQYLGYVRDQGSNTYPPAQPEFMSSAGQRINRGFDVNFV